MVGVHSAAAKLRKKYSTQRYKAGIRGHTNIKNESNFNLLLSSLWFLGVFVFKDFFAKKTKTLLVILQVAYTKIKKSYSV